MSDLLTNSLTQVGFSGGLSTNGVEPMATHCRECGRPLINVPGKVQKEFDSKEHSNKFNARRTSRGSQLYDLLMADQFAPVMSHEETLKAVADALQAWRENDIEEREGRPSWNDPTRAK